MSETIIAVAMSGGVDSSTAAGLLRRQGHAVVGVTMQFWNQKRLPELNTGDSSRRCCMLDDVYDARQVAESIGIPYHLVNFEKHFERQVVQPFIEEYLAGRTPIPCTLCNTCIKFDQFLALAAGFGAERIATGHYARVSYDAGSGRYQLHRGVDSGKDQTYFLFGLTQAQLARTLFPLGEFTKTQVRAMAAEMGIPVAGKSESQEICFVPNGDYGAFIDAYFREQGLAQPRDPGRDRDHRGTSSGRARGRSPFHRRSETRVWASPSASRCT